MTDAESEFIDVALLRIGLFVYIDLGWLSHPFPLNAFKLRSQDQIDTIRSLGLRRIRYSPDKSDPETPDTAATAHSVCVADPVETARRVRQEILHRQKTSLKICERQFNDASRAYRQISDIFHSQPELARQASDAMVSGVIDKLLSEEESSIRLLSEQIGERTSLHAVNVTVIALLLARAMSLSTDEMHMIGLGALLHDIGKQDLPNRLRWRDDHFSAAELLIHQEHVGHSVAAGRKLGLSAGALLVIAQHHELADGSGYPQRLRSDKITLPSRIVGLVNHYDNLCNPNNPSVGITPHEALALMFAQQKSRFDGTVMSAFIRMMGVYPPGSIVQLTDDRYALVVSVNSNRPLKPQVVIHQPEIPRDEALVVDLEIAPELGIRRSLKPLQLPKATIDYLSPRERICYFFERALGSDSAGETTT
jgi:putative nucleotidyltransferase with HDIG domain